MGVMLSDKVKIFKFRETGIVALCHEVSEYVVSDRVERDRIDIASARYEEDDDYIYVVFDRLEN